MMDAKPCIDFLVNLNILILASICAEKFSMMS
jgi:hypothetical protein